jgi:hypothetical protein
MKKNPLFRWRSFGCILTLLAGTALLVGGKSAGNYSAHEWGTFTSVQGADGVLLEWYPLESSRLPAFVYSWMQPGVSRQLPAQLGLSKGMPALQRMETPVIYFYSDTEQSVDVTVEFPQGRITEWYPQATQLGPSTMPPRPSIVKLDQMAHKVGAKSSFTFESLFGNRDVKESKARWASVRLLPADTKTELQTLLPQDRSGSHYFAARETDANFLRVKSIVATNPAPEHEKFIFYRGVGSFATPLRVTMQADESMVVSNTGSEELEHLFVLEVGKGRGRFMALGSLAAGRQEAFSLDALGEELAMKQLPELLGKSLVAALVKSGLYEREALAMVNTWKESWFDEEGLRVLYVLPRNWTDATLPLTLDPAPRELVRVMVGRAEVISPALQRRLAEGLVRAGNGDAAAEQEMLALFGTLGRFGEPALRMASRGTSQEVQQHAWNLFQTAAKR